MILLGFLGRFLEAIEAAVAPYEMAADHPFTKVGLIGSLSVRAALLPQEWYPGNRRDDPDRKRRGDPDRILIAIRWPSPW